MLSDAFQSRLRVKASFPLISTNNNKKTIMLKKWPAEEVAKGVMGGGGVVMRGYFSEEYLLPKGPMRPGV